MMHKIIRHRAVDGVLVQDCLTDAQAWALVDKAREQEALVDALIDELFYRVGALNLPEPSPLHALEDELSDLLVAYGERRDLLHKIRE